MRWARVVWEAYVTRLEDALERYRRHRLSADEAGEMLGLSGRQFRRLRDRYEAEGVEGLRDRRLGRVSPRRAPESELARMRRLYREDDADFTVKHVHEVLRERRGDRLGYTVTRLSLQAAGLVKAAARRGKHRKKRLRRPLPGMLLFQDGSQHRWIGALGHDLDLVVTLDDATGCITSALLVEQEGTQSSFAGLFETIAAHGLFGALYTDRGSHYFHTPKAGGKVAKTRPTQVGRALAQLGIRHIPSYSPEARGRMERVFGTVQQRLPPELRRAGVTTMAAANGYLREHFVPAYNARFGKPAAEAGTAFVAYAGAALRDVLCVQGRRHRLRPPGGARQLRRLGRDAVADPSAAAPPPLRPGDGAGACVSGRDARGLRWPALPGALRRRRGGADGAALTGRR
jgi:transposase